MVQFLAHEGQLEPIGLTEDLQGKIIQPDAQTAAALNPRPGVAIVEMIVTGNIEALDRFYDGWHAFGFGGKNIFKILVEVAFVTAKVIGACAIGDPSGQTVPADAIQRRLPTHGVLPTDLFPLGNLGPQGVVILASGAIVKIVAAFVLDCPGLHPQTGIVGLGLFIRFDDPYLAPEHGPDPGFLSYFMAIPAMIRRSVTDVASWMSVTFFSHFCSPLLVILYMLDLVLTGVVLIRINRVW
jgi:hypothetical protein